VRLAVHACGVCHSDSELVIGHWPGLTFPVTPDTKSPGSSRRLATPRLLRLLPRCRRRDFIYYEQGWVTGATIAGGFARWIGQRVSSAPPHPKCSVLHR